MPAKPFEPRYSGEASTDIWERIAGIEDPEGSLIYIAACALQDHEQRFLQMIQGFGYPAVTGDKEKVDLQGKNE